MGWRENSTGVHVADRATSANDHTMSMGKKTIAPADVFKALDDVEFGFLKERLEAEYNSMSPLRASRSLGFSAPGPGGEQGRQAGTLLT